MFPHPLEQPSSTWLGTLSAESGLRRAATSAEVNFRTFFSTHGGIEEEACTRVLLDSLEAEVRRAGVAARAIARHSATAPLVTMGHRQVPKREKAKWGCDLGFEIVAFLQQAIKIRVAEFVQVKKSESLRRGGIDRWRITTEQLNTLLSLSQSSVYWLIGRNGEIFVVPAKILAGVAAAQRIGGATVTVHYNSVRSAAISLSQFFTDLLVGMWLGSSSEQALRIAAGDDNRTTPRYVVTVSVYSERDR